MGLILNIDTAFESASVSVAREGHVIVAAGNDKQQDHAVWLHHAVVEILQDASINMKDLDAIAVNMGPGSYTGLRVGLSSAKGFCLALSIPLITVNSLELIASAVSSEGFDLICPMIDARRMEVFTALYDQSLNVILPPSAMIIDENSFNKQLMGNKILFCGNGCAKLRTTITHSNAFYTDRSYSTENLAILSEHFHSLSVYADLIYAEPLYLKEFYTMPKSS
jgi:tRNA threonylcarbamoyladenosine biosynthesis protein TsaB